MALKMPKEFFKIHLCLSQRAELSHKGIKLNCERNFLKCFRGFHPPDTLSKAFKLMKVVLLVSKKGASLFPGSFWPCELTKAQCSRSARCDLMLLLSATARSEQESYLF